MWYSMHGTQLLPIAAPSATSSRSRSVRFVMVSSSCPFRRKGEPKRYISDGRVIEEQAQLFGMPRCRPREDSLANAKPALEKRPNLLLARRRRDHCAILRGLQHEDLLTGDRLVREELGRVGADDRLAPALPPDPPHHRRDVLQDGAMQGKLGLLQ